MRNNTNNEAVRAYVKHGLSKVNGRQTKEYKAWCDAKGRCHNTQHRAFKYYGNRGIQMCEEWKISFESFLLHIGPSSAGSSLDRIDNNKGYEPGNVRWTTRSDQQNNRRGNKIATVKGVTGTYAQLANHFQTPVKNIYGRLSYWLKRGLDIEYVFTARKQIKGIDY